MLQAWKKTALLGMSIILLNACASSAQINEQAAMSYTQEISQLRNKGVVDTSSTTAKRINQVFQKMVPYANKENQTGQPFNWEISVVKSKELNAWAMPGGKMMFYTGLVDQLKLTNDEIAVVMGHEMAHALQEHGKSKVNMSQISGIAAQIAHIALSTQIGSQASGMVVSVAKDWGLDKPYSRSHETEADEVGLMLMAKAGYNPQAAPNLWIKMNQATGNSNSALAGLVSTHPTNAARQANLERLMPQAMEYYKASK
ncbi:M48 family metallopeptidase [Conservatibacter flavescens]|uniref:Deoxyribonuclease HsdR n=1 Tax=Conservatibacter flavescens TaxID=28161 RepID=A0A2M8S3K0_9PAST|nr:M48 family metallopeptidase [Conservatibacter flavescens]PJG85710.1 deoxyribonuclease HsdR [Conservatibacter flavescens]